MRYSCYVGVASAALWPSLNSQEYCLQLLLLHHSINSINNNGPKIIVNIKPIAEKYRAKSAL